MKMTKRSGLQIGIIVLGIIIGMIPLLKIFIRPEERPIVDPCKRNLRQIGAACLMYTIDNDGVFPSDLILLIPGQIGDDQILACNIARKKSKEKVLFVYFSGLRKDSLKDSVLAYCPYHEGGGNVLYADGHVKWKKHSETKDELRKMLDTPGYRQQYSKQALELMEKILKRGGAY